MCKDLFFTTSLALAIFSASFVLRLHVNKAMCTTQRCGTADRQTTTRTEASVGQGL